LKQIDTLHGAHTLQPWHLSRWGHRMARWRPPRHQLAVLGCVTRRKE